VALADDDGDLMKAILEGVKEERLGVVDENQHMVDKLHIRIFLSFSPRMTNFTTEECWPGWRSLCEPDLCQHFALYQQLHGICRPKPTSTAVSIL
jgi:hypothetical protein